MNNQPIEDEVVATLGISKDADESDEEEFEEIEEEREVEVFEFSLDVEEIEELIDKLHVLKESGEQIEVDVDEGNTLLINRADDEDYGNGEEDELE